MNAETWLGVLGFGGLCGLLGQAARVLIGFKKLSDTASAGSSSTKDLIDPDRLFVSLLIGFIAGALAGTLIFTAWPTIAMPQILSAAAAGYSGSDFLEGLMTRATPPTVAASGNGTGDAGSANSPPPTTSDGAVG